MKYIKDLASEAKHSWALLLNALNLNLSVNKTHLLLPNRELNVDISKTRFDIILFDFPIIVESNSYIHSTPIAVISPVDNITEMSSLSEDFPLMLYWLV